MPSSTVEDYLKAIYHLQERGSSKRVAMGEIAKRLNVVPGTTTTMIKALAKQDLVDYTARKGVRLSETGHRLAVGIVHRHRLIETFLVNTLELPDAEIHQEAELLEHAVSERVLGALDRFLGYPAEDPHGQPIPRPDAAVSEA